MDCEVKLDMETKFPGEKNKIAHSLMEVFSQFNRINWDKSPIEGIKHSELVVLFCIKRMVPPGSPGIKVSEISNLLRVTSPSITQIITGLEADGYVERNIDKEDRRAIRVTLTAKAENVIAQAFEKLLTSFSGLVEYLGEEDSIQLVQLLVRVKDYFHEVKPFK